MKYSCFRSGVFLSVSALFLASSVVLPAQAEEVDPAASSQSLESVVASLAPGEVAEKTDRFVVHFKDGDKAAQKRVLESVELEIPELENVEVIKESLAEDPSMVVIGGDKLLDEAEQQEAIKALEEDPRVDFVEPDPVVNALSALPSEEPLFTLQWALNSTYLNGPAAWQLGYTGDGQVVGIVDTGYSVHPDLKEPIAQYDFVSDLALSLDGNGRDADARDTSSRAAGVNWHGTFIDGQIAAKANGYGITGLAHGANVTHARALGFLGDGHGSDIADAITWAAGGRVAGVPDNPNPATVINASLAYPSSQGKCSGFMAAAINSALAREVPVVVAAGNAGRNAAAYEPANCWRAIVVGATGHDNTLAAYSNWGSTLDVVAPGGSVSHPIYSTDNTGFYGVGSPSFGNKYGTSMAAPHVAATVALMQEANPRLTVEQIRQALTGTASTVSGYKFINPEAAVRAVLPAGSFATVRGSEIEQAYLSGGSSAVFGLPTSNQFATRDGGFAQSFAKNYTLYWSPFTAANAVNFSTAIGAFYARAGFENAYGYPMAAEESLPGGAQQRFRMKGGKETALVWSATTGVSTLDARAEIYNYWRNTGLGQNFGYPVSSEKVEADGSRSLALSSGVTLRWSAQKGIQVIGFTDTAAHSFEKEILWLAETGISTGWFDATFRPEADVQRAAMAAFFYRMAGSPAFVPPAKPTFRDVPTSHQFYKEIEWMAARGLATGWDDGTFRPYESTQRAAMAAFFYRYSGSPAVRLPRAAAFTDVAQGNAFYREISWFSQQNITTGWADGTFRPTQSVSRGAMAAFIYRYMNR